jgi:hypothetical protein
MINGRATFANLLIIAAFVIIYIICLPSLNNKLQA